MRRKRVQGAALLLAGALLLQPLTGHCMELSLQEAIDTALCNNTSLRVTQKAEDKAEANLRKARGTNGLTISASDNLNTSKSSDSERSSSNSFGLSASLPVYTGGKNQASIKSSELGVDAAVLSTERARENMKLSVIKAYYDALEAKKNIDVYQERVDKYQAHYTNVQQLYSAGSKARVDVLRSSVELSNAQQDLIRSQNGYEVNLAVLRNLMNVDRSEPIQLTDDFVYDLFQIDMPDCILYAYEHRKDLKVDEVTLEQRELAIKSAKAGYLPTVRLSVGVDPLKTRLEPSASSSSGWSAGLNANWNIFDSGVTSAEVDSAKTERDIAELTLQKDREEIDLALRKAYFNMREAEKRLNSTKLAVDQAREDSYIATEKYRAGEGIMLDVIDAQEALTASQYNYISAQYDYVRYKAEVENAMGIGLTEEEALASMGMVQESKPVTEETGQSEKAVTDTASAEKVAEEAAGSEVGR